jgi:hypothetical protein
MTTTDDLIERLAATAMPVRPLAPPLLRALGWLTFALVVVVAMVAIHGPRADLAAQFARATFVAEWLVSLVTGVAAALAAFHLAQPDRSRRWLWVALVPAAMWVATLGVGCVADWVALGPAGFVLATSFPCLKIITFGSLPLVLALSVMLRHAARIRPVETMATGALAAAALSAAGLSLFHHLDASVMILIWHIGSVTLVVTVWSLIARPVLTWFGNARSPLAA